MNSRLGPVVRSLNVVRLLAESGGRTTIQAASAVLDLAPSTVHRLLDILVRDGMVERDKAERSYRIGPELFGIAARIVERNDMRTLALPVLHEVVELCDETCFLGVYLPIPRKMIFAEKADSSQRKRSGDPRLFAPRSDHTDPSRGRTGAELRRTSAFARNAGSPDSKDQGPWLRHHSWPEAR